jgi:hypothetical protein
MKLEVIELNDSVQLIFEYMGKITTFYTTEKEIYKHLSRDVNQVSFSCIEIMRVVGFKYKEEDL